MKRKPETDTTKQFQKLLEAQPPSERYLLRLFVTGSTPRSALAIRNIRELCEEKLHGRYDLEVIDIYQYPAAAVPEQIVVAPTLIKKLPLPLRRIIGDLSDKERVLAGLDIVPQNAAPAAEKPDGA